MSILIAVLLFKIKDQVIVDKSSDIKCIVYFPFVNCVVPLLLLVATFFQINPQYLIRIYEKAIKCY